MPIKEREESILRNAFTAIVKRPVYSIDKSSGGLDNSVYYISLDEGQLPQYVLKIIESKSDETIQDAIALSNNLKEFTKLEFYQADNGNYLHSSEYLDRNFVIMNFLSGRHPDISNPDDSQAVAVFSAKLHNAIPRQQVSPKDLLKQELELISEYYSNALIHSMNSVEGERGIWYKKRASIYRSCNTILNRLLIMQQPLFDNEHYFITRGITHGDLNTGNMIIGDDGNISFIDPDAIDRSGFQITDILHAASKSNIITSAEKTDSFFNAYLEEKGDCNLDKSMLYTLLFCLSFRASLSTDYYTKDVGSIPKISTDWVYSNAKDTLDKLSYTLKATSRILGVDIRIFDRNNEDCATIR